MKEESNKERIERKLRVLEGYVSELGYSDEELDLIDRVLTLVIMKKNYPKDMIETAKEMLIRSVKSYENK
jgi:hypothetical protein